MYHSDWQGLGEVGDGKVFILFYFFYCAGSLLRHAVFSGCDAWALLPHYLWGLGSLTRDSTCIPFIAFFTTGPPGKSSWEITV